MVNTWSENPELITPNFTARVTPPRTTNPSVVDRSFDASIFQSAENSFIGMADNSTNSPSVPSGQNQIPFPSTSTPQHTPQDPPMTHPSTPEEHANSREPGKLTEETKDGQSIPSRSLEQIIAGELEKSGLSGIDDNLLKVLLIRNLTRSHIDSEQATVSSKSLV
ncbi:uncharacterized protein PGTG_22078 [Puccinia graminis f. sp. tritici CRL 75-36-700-3]|uniref:Uncharacterized protein n=1 Tax=Puccinia graminis f. sp. tritici (strain CRL 75-36-700-3 / race SCCL) TaxID=418459 RepID=H6QTF3_PUCGT|nr:uncharacterized protein PGTG_22078 [Puccinia graminis f. sp. tritici CRL 75-36-700-3]EHS64168.1 hypothetical protein PGTG_22078 [Puccinia graminis f. sp. tritici CRL 75-36-700-3]